MIRTLVRHPVVLTGSFTLCWAVIELVGPAAGVSAYQVVWTRYGVHLLVLGLLFGRRNGLGLVRSAQPAREVISSLLMLGMPICFLRAAQRMPLRDEMAVFWVAPVMVVAIATVVTGQHGGARTMAAAAAGLLGAVLIYRPDTGVFRPAAGLALGMAACFALYLVVVGTMHQDATPTKLFHTAFWVFAALTLMLPRFWHTPTPRGVLAMVLVGVLGYAGLYALDVALEATPPAVLAPVLYTQLAWDVLLHALLRLPSDAAAPTSATLAGLVLVLAAAGPALAWRTHAARVVPGVVRGAGA